MDDFARRVVIDVPFARAVELATHALEARGFEMATTLDVQGMVRRRLGAECRAYAVLLVWAPDLVLEALRTDLDAVALLPWHVGVYELADGESVLALDEPLGEALLNAREEDVSPRLTQIATEVESRLALALTDIAHAARAAAPVH